MLGPKQVIKTQVPGQIIGRELGEMRQGLHVKEGRAGSRSVKPKMETLIVGLGPGWLQQRFLFLKILTYVCLSKANLFSEHLLSPLCAWHCIKY